MKKIFIVLLILIITPKCFAQKCKYERNEIIQESNQHIRVSKKIKIYEKLYTASLIGLSNFNGTYSLEYCHVFYSGCATTYEGCEITFLLENGKSITLKKGKMDYSVSQDQIQSMLKFKVSKVRYQYGDNPTNTKFVEVDIKTKHAESIIELIKCIL